MANKPTYPAKYFIRRLILADGRAFDFRNADWHCQFIPVDRRTADLILHPLRAAFNPRKVSLSTVAKAWRGPSKLKRVEYTITAQAGDEFITGGFFHDFKRGSTSVSGRSIRVATHGPALFADYPLNSLLKSRRFRDQRAVQFVS